MSNDEVPLVVVTGANGYIGQHVLQKLLDSHVRARAVVRSQSSADAVKNVLKGHRNAFLLETSLVPDLLGGEQVYKEAFAGATAVVHLASPLPEMEVSKDAETKFLKPAIEGTLNAAKAAALERATCKRFVLASSITASFGSLLPKSPDFTVDTWGPYTYEQACKMTIDAQIYCASKQLAEQAFWKYYREEKPAYTATALLPSICIGNGLDPQSAPDISTNRYPLAWTRAAPMFYPSIKRDVVPFEAYPVVDVQDCANAFVNAALAPQPSPLVDDKRLYVSERVVDYISGFELALQSEPALTKEWPEDVRAGIQELCKSTAKEREASVFHPQPFQDGAKALGIAPLRTAQDVIKEVFKKETHHLGKA